MGYGGGGGSGGGGGGAGGSGGSSSGYGAGYGSSGDDAYIEKSPLQPTPVGAIRFNTDSSKMEYYDGNQWVNVTSTSPEVQTGGTRALFGGGYTPSSTDRIDYVNVDTTGNAIDFGDLTREYGQGSAAASRTRGVFFAGQQPSPTYGPQIDYVTISSTGDAIDWGVDMTGAVGTDACGNETRGLVMGGNTDHETVIDYITICLLYTSDAADE